MNLKTFFTAAAIASCMATLSAANEVKGEVTHVRDADTIEVRGIAIRLDGVDAPDKGQLGCKEGKDWMKRNYAGRMVRCDLTGAKT